MGLWIGGGMQIGGGGMQKYSVVDMDVMENEMWDEDGFVDKAVDTYVLCIYMHTSLYVKRTRNCTRVALIYLYLALGSPGYELMIHVHGRILV